MNSVLKPPVPYGLRGFVSSSTKDVVNQVRGEISPLLDMGKQNWECEVWTFSEEPGWS